MSTPAQIGTGAEPTDSWGDNDFNYESHTLLIQTLAQGLQLATRLSTEVRIRRHVIHPAHVVHS